MESKMTESLLNTLNALSARDQVASDASLPGFNPDDYDKSTGEWTGEPPEGYKPIEAPEIKVESKNTAVQEFEHSDATEDYVRVRDTTYAMQEATLLMMQEAAKLAANTEAPRAFSVFRELGELMRGLNKDLMENQKTFKMVTLGDSPKGAEGDDEAGAGATIDGEAKVKVSKTTKRSSRDLMEVANQIRAEKEADERERRRLDAEKRAAEATDAEFENVEDKPNANATPDSETPD